MSPFTANPAPRRPGRPGRPTHIDGPADLLQSVPYLLGFHPAESLVLVGLDGPTLVVTARVDLADAGGASGPDLLVSVLGAFTDGGVRRLIAAVYTDRPGPVGLPRGWADLVTALWVACQRTGCELADVLRVTDGRWWSRLGAGSGRMAVVGPASELPTAPSPFVAGAALDGVVALPDRATLVATLDPLPAEQRDRLRSLLGEQVRPGVRTALRSAAQRSARPGWVYGFDDATTAGFGSALRVRAERDRIWTVLDRGELDGRPLWRELARRLPAPYDAAPLFLYAWASWRAGNGVLAGAAAERALGSDPDYGVAHLLLTALSHGLDPRRVPHLEPRRGRPSTVA